MRVKTPTQHCRRLIINAVDLWLSAKRRRLQRIEWLQHSCNTWAVQKRVSVETGSHSGKASSECPPPSAKTIIFPTAGSTFPWNCSTKRGGKIMRGLIKKKKFIDVFVLVMVPLTRRKFEQRRQQEELSTWQLIQSIWCSISHFVWSSAAQLCTSNRSSGAKLQQPARPLWVKVSRFF